MCNDDYHDIAERVHAEYTAESKIEELTKRCDDLLVTLRLCADRLGEMDCGLEWEQARTTIERNTP